MNEKPSVWIYSSIPVLSCVPFVFLSFDVCMYVDCYLLIACVCYGVVYGIRCIVYSACIALHDPCVVVL